MLKFQSDGEPSADLLTEITLLVRSGCSVHFDPQLSPYGVVLAQIKVAPPDASTARPCSAIGLPLAPFIHQFNVVTDAANVAAALRNARRLFIALSAH